MEKGGKEIKYGTVKWGEIQIRIVTTFITLALRL
jgi:hypothetical protein